VDKPGESAADKRVKARLDYGIAKRDRGNTGEERNKNGDKLTWNHSDGVDVCHGNPRHASMSQRLLLVPGCPSRWL
jgi:hypothetical protein